MTFKDKTYAQRITDPMFYHSEVKFEERWTGPWERYGLGPASDGMASYKYDPFISHTPDYRAAFTEHGRPFLVEVQGTGTAAQVRTHKFKEKKLEELGKWNRLNDVVFWLWDDKTETYTMIRYNQIRLAIMQGKSTQGSFDGKRPYQALTVDWCNEHNEEEGLRSLYG